MMRGPDVSIIVVSHNSHVDLLANLPAVADLPDELIIVDNASSDGSAALVRELAPRARVLELDRNVGFGAANNEGMTIGSGRYFLLLNPDARPLGDAIERLVAFADAHPEVGVAGPKLVNPDGSLQRSILGYPTALWRGTPPRRRAPRLSLFFFARRWFPRRAGRLTEEQHKTRRPLRDEWLKGAVLLLRREAVDDVGGFDPAFFLYNEEIDLCYRMREAGWSIELVPEATFVHAGGAAARSSQYAYRDLLRGHLRLLAKHRGLTRAEQARRYLALILRLRALISRGEMRRIYRDAARWLSSADVPALLRGEG